MTPEDVPFVDIRGLTVTFTAGRKPVRAVDGVDLQVRRGEVVALIGESGSGKSVTLRSLLRLHTPRHTQIGGHMRVGEHDVLALSPGALADLLREFRAAGGEAIEVITGSHSPDQYALFAAIAENQAFLVSRGSDFHAPGEGSADFGKLPPLAAHLKPVWHDWRL